MNIPKLIVIVFTMVCLSTLGLARATPIDPYGAINNWTAGLDPVSLSGVALSNWGVVTHTDPMDPPAGIVNDAGQISAPRGSLTSDFVATGDFVFSGLMRATGPCLDGGAFGIVFGWQDRSSTYYLEWSGYTTAGNGLLPPRISLVKVHNFDRITLASHASFDYCTWVEDGWYSFDLTRSGDDLSIDIRLLYGSSGLPSTYPFSTIITDTTFMSGRVGLWASGQTAEWGNLDMQPSPIPEPATALLISSGLLAVAGLSWGRKKN